MAEIRVTINVEIVGPAGRTFDTGASIVEHSGDNPAFFALEYSIIEQKVHEQVVKALLAVHGKPPYTAVPAHMRDGLGV